MLVIEDSEEAILVSTKELEQVMCIQYFIAFPDSITQDGLVLDPLSALFNLSSKVNVIHSTFVKKLGFLVQTINIDTQKIDGTTLESYRMVVAAFSMTNQVNKVKFFEKIFLVANIRPDVVLGMLFLNLE